MVAEAVRGRRVGRGQHKGGLLESRLEFEAKKRKSGKGD